MKKQILINAIAIACFGTLAMSAGAQSQMGTTTQQPPQSSSGMDPMGNGSLDGAAKPRSTMGAGNAMGNTMQNGNAANNGSSQLYTDYKREWQRCAGLPIGQQNSCLEMVTKQYSVLAPRCQKFSGSAFDNCIRNSD
jgi:hypothetical protein